MALRISLALGVVTLLLLTGLLIGCCLCFSRRTNPCGMCASGDAVVTALHGRSGCSFNATATDPNADASAMQQAASANQYTLNQFGTYALRFDGTPNTY